MDYDETQRKNKQQLLYTEIIEAGYDGNAFQIYLETKKPNGGNNVDLWTYGELEELLKEFKRLHDENKIVEVSLEKQEDPISDTNLEENKLEKSKIEGKDKDIFDDENFQKTITCKEIIKPSADLNIPNLKIEIIDYKVIPGGIFSSSYANFRIHTLPFDWEVNRRFSDFLWLRTYLIKIYPGIFIPPIPTKKAKRSLEDLYLNKRKAFLERFLKDCLKNNLIKNTQIFIDFISLKDDLAFNVKKKDANNKKAPEKPDQNITLNGKVDLSINEEITNYIKYASEYIVDADSLYLKLRKLNNQLLLDFDQVSSTLFSMGDIFSSLYKKSNYFNNHISKNQNMKLDYIYVMLNNMMVNWGDTIAHQTVIIQESLCNFFKYEKHYNQCMIEILKERNNACNEYYKAKNREAKKLAEAQKDKKFVDVSKLSNMFQRDVNLLYLKENFAYYNNQTYLEIPKCLEDKCEKYMKQFISFGSLQTEIVTNMHVIWADIISRFEDFYGNVKQNNSLTLKKGGENSNKPKKSGEKIDVGD